MSSAPPGWHPDPNNPSATLRWWDGSAWTAHTHPAVTAQPQAAQYGGQLGSQPPVAQYGAPPPQWAGQPASFTGTAGSAPQAPYPNAYTQVGMAQRPGNFAQQNSLSLVAAGVCVLYVLLAIVVHVVFLGIVPVVLAVRAVKAKERLAPVAVLAAIVAVGAAVLPLI